MKRSATEAIRHVQQTMADRGFDPGEIDGAWGNKTEGAFEAFTAAASTCMSDAPVIPYPAPVPGVGMAWGAKVSATFRDRIVWISDQLQMPSSLGPSALMSCIAFETGRTFSPSVRNGAGSGATGLIQFMPSTAIAFFFSSEDIKRMSASTKKLNGQWACDKLAKMSAEDQLNYVYRYFRPFTGRLKNLGDVYMSILWPLGVGQPDSFVLWDEGSRPTTYRQNSGLDVNKDKRITRGEALSKIEAIQQEGHRAPNYWAG